MKLTSIKSMNNINQTERNIMKTSFSRKCPVNIEGSWGGSRLKDEAILEFNVQVDDKKQYGSYEFYDVDSYDCYAEGGLWFSKGELVDYDGVMSLPLEILDVLELDGWDVKSMRKSLES